MCACWLGNDDLTTPRRLLLMLLPRLRLQEISADSLAAIVNLSDDAKCLGALIHCKVVAAVMENIMVRAPPPRGTSAAAGRTHVHARRPPPRCAGR